MKRIVLGLLFAGQIHAAAPVFFRTWPSPAAPDSQCSNLVAGPDGTLHLTWSGASERPGERALRHASLAPGAREWSAPRIIISTTLLMENWADFASMCVGTDGALTAQWFQRPSEGEARGYDGWFSRSTDHGKTWRAPARLGHEFVSLAPLSGGRTLAVWLESARMRDPTTPRVKRDPKAPRPARDPSAPYAPSMKLSACLLAPDGSRLGEWTVDPDVCTCCQTTAAVLPGDRVFIAYRGHDADEIRDNRQVIFDLAGSTFTKPTSLHEDRWKIPACPVNGPAADAHGATLAVAWFTAADGAPKVQVRSSNDGGKTMGEAVRVDLGRPMGRIETVVLGDGSALILWMEAGTTENAAGIHARRLLPDGRLSQPRLLADSSQARASGFPRAARRADGRVIVAWTRSGEPNQVQIGEIDASALPVSDLRTSRAFFSVPPPLEFCEVPVSQHAAFGSPAVPVAHAEGATPSVP